MKFVNICKEILTSPSNFFQRMPVEGGYEEPLTFTVLTTSIYFILLGISNSIFYPYTSSYEMEFICTSKGIPMFLGGVVVALFVGGAMYHILFKLVGGKGSYEGTIRVLAYSNAVLLLNWIPYISNIIPFYGIYLLVLGGIHVHKLNMKKSAVAVLIPFISILVTAMITL